MRVPGTLGFIKYNNLFDRGLISLFQSFTNKHMNVLNERSNGSLATGFSQAAFVVSCNCRRNDFYERTIPGKENSGGTILSSQCRIVDNIQPGEGLASTGNAGNKANDLL